MPDIEYAYYLWATLLLFGGIVGWSMNFLNLPGNWIIVGLAAAFASVLPAANASGLGWEAVGLLIALAVGGEVLETMAGAAGAARKGASRRAMVLAVVGTIAGSITGAIVGLPVPIVGPVLGALAGGAGGAFAGAYLGEMWKGSNADDRFAISWGALIGRLLGTAGKLAVGTVMLVVLGVRAFSGGP